MKKDNNYAADIVELFSPHKEMSKLPFIETGEVIAPMPELAIKIRDITYKKKKIKINEYLLKNHEREIHIPNQTFTGSDSHGDSHISGEYPEGTKLIFTDDLKVGDKLAVMQSRDKQTLYVFFRIKEL